MTLRQACLSHHVSECLNRSLFYASSEMTLNDDIGSKSQVREDSKFRSRVSNVLTFENKPFNEGAKHFKTWHRNLIAHVAVTQRW